LCHQEGPLSIFKAAAMAAPQALAPAPGGARLLVRAAEMEVASRWGRR